jgi:hypothetical protein
MLESMKNQYAVKGEHVQCEMMTRRVITETVVISMPRMEAEVMQKSLITGMALPLTESFENVIGEIIGFEILGDA